VRAFLVTGATGFLGKVVLETLLRRRAELDFDRVWVLVRANDRSAAAARLEREVLGSACFEKLPAGELERVNLLFGDVASPGCALDAADRERVAGSVERIIHCAASVEFDLPLTAAAAINVQGALEVVELAKHCPALQSLVLVSTAYVTPAREAFCRAEERLAPLPRSAAQLYREIRDGSAEHDTLLAETGHPNTYTLTKSIAEHLAVERGRELPLCIVRPSVISASRHHPFPGWIDSHAAFASIVAAIGTGQLRAIAARPEARIDLVPCDDVARAAIDASLDPPPPGEPAIRHATAGWERSGTVAECRRGIEKFFTRHRITGGPRVAYLGPRGARFTLEEFARHRVPLGWSEGRARLARRRARQNSIRRLRERVLELNRVFPYFTHHSFDFRAARPVLSDDFNPRDYIEIVCGGVHRHLLRQDPRALTFAGRDHPVAASDWRDALRLRGGGLARYAAAWVLTKLFRRSATRITFDLRALEAAVAQTSDGEGCVIVPSHRSYYDFLLLPYLFYMRPEVGIASPEIAADEQFGRVPVLGHLARHCGAFFLRRGLGAEDKELTQTVHRLAEAGRPILFFIEGGRSRSREFLPPRRGMLRCLQGTGRRFHLLPTMVNYDRVPEEATFEQELQGEQPARIRLRTLLAWLGKVRRGEVDLGRIHVSFGTPLELDLSSDVQTLAERVIDELERSLVATTYHLRCFLAEHPIEGVDLRWLTAAIRERGGRVLRSRLRTPRVSGPIEVSLQKQWKHVFRSDSQRVLALRREGRDPCENLDPRLVNLVGILFESVGRGFSEEVGL